VSVVAVFQNFDESASLDQLYKSDRQLSFLVVVDDVQDGGTIILDAEDGITRIPLVNELVGGYRVASKEYKRDSDNPLHFRVTAKLSNSANDKAKPSGKEKLNVQIKVSTEPFEEAVYLDRNKRPICNSAGQPFSNQPTKTFYDEKISVTFDTGEVDQASIEATKGKINSNTVSLTIRGLRRSFAPGTLRFIDSPYSSKTSQTPQGEEYIWSVEYTLAYRADKWTRKILNMGRMQKVNNELTHIYIGNQLATEDVPLDKDGRALVDAIVEVAVPIVTAARGQRCYTEFDIEDQASFAALLNGVR
jgi:hypothetical protein